MRKEIQKGAFEKAGELIAEAAAHWIGKLVGGIAVTALSALLIAWHGQHVQAAAVAEADAKRAWVGDDLARHTDRMTLIDSNAVKRLDDLQFQVWELTSELGKLKSKKK